MDGVRARREARRSGRRSLGDRLRVRQRGQPRTGAVGPGVGSWQGSEQPPVCALRAGPAPGRTTPPPEGPRRGSGWPPSPTWTATRRGPCSGGSSGTVSSAGGGNRAGSAARNGSAARSASAAARNGKSERCRARSCRRGAVALRAAERGCALRPCLERRVPHRWQRVLGRSRPSAFCSRGTHAGLVPSFAVRRCVSRRGARCLKPQPRCCRWDSDAAVCHRMCQPS